MSDSTRCAAPPSHREKMRSSGNFNFLFHYHKLPKNGKRNSITLVVLSCFNCHMARGEEDSFRIDTSYKANSHMLEIIRYKRIERDATSTNLI